MNPAGPWICVLSLLAAPPARAESVTERIDGPGPARGQAAPLLGRERVLRLSPDRRILVLGNEANSFERGDFLTLLLSGRPVARGLAAKMDGYRAGVKIVRLYAPAIWDRVEAGMEVQVLRGDDSYYGALERAAKKKEAPKDLTREEEDLYEETLLMEGGLDVEEEGNRTVKTDNILSGLVSTIEGADLDGNAAWYRQIAGSWMYQIHSNVWAEFLYGQSVINDFPNLGLDTKLNAFSFRLKYIVAAPFYSYLQPYAGYQVVGASSPGAGLDDGKTSNSVLDLELDRMESLERRTMVFGVTLLRRLVPGWMAKLDVGTDTVAFGLALEF